MDKFVKKNLRGPESIIETDIMKMMRHKGWLVRKMHGDANNNGWPDLYCTHSKYGIRWVEVKLPDMKGSRWTQAQKEWFPKMQANGTRIWVLTGDSEDEYRKLFADANFYFYYLRKML